MWGVAGTVFTSIISLIGIIGGPVGAGFVITIHFAVVGLILEGLSVHERYVKLEQLIKDLTPIEAKVSEAYNSYLKEMHK